MAASSEYLQLLDWRRRMAGLFAEARSKSGTEAALMAFRAQKDELFRSHPQSPIPADHRPGFKGLRYWPYAAAARVSATFQPGTEDPDGLGPDAPPSTSTPTPAGAGVASGADAELIRFGSLRFDYGGSSCTLGAFWLAGYGGGLFVPFRDATSGHETYGGGRYLIDSIKGADLGSDWTAGTVMLDFNYAYHPSCAYDPRWSCPLAPGANWLAVPVLAGERLQGQFP